MAIDTKCHVCGSCWWVSCSNDADYARDVDLRLKRSIGLGDLVYSGKVELCAGHTRQSFAENRMDLNWDALEQAVALQEARA